MPEVMCGEGEVRSVLTKAEECIAQLPLDSEWLFCAHHFAEAASRNRTASVEVGFTFGLCFG